jgi:hypothetical protein
MFTGINATICRQAFYTIMPAIERAAKEGTTNKLKGVIVVLDPRLRPVMGTQTEMQDAVLFTDSVDPTINGEQQKYGEIALSKAFVTWRTGQPSCRIQQEFPYQYEAGMTKWGGSTVDRGGLIVAFSGVQAVFDEMIAEWMASAIRAICRWEMTGTDGVMSTDSSFVGR